MSYYIYTMTLIANGPCILLSISSMDIIRLISFFSKYINQNIWKAFRSVFFIHKSATVISVQIKAQ